MLVDFAELTVMMLAGLLFLLSLTGGSASNQSAPPVLLDDHLRSNNSFEQNGSASNYSTTTYPPHDLLTGFKPEENGSTPKSNCTLRDVLRYMNLTKNIEISMIRPGYYGSPTKVGLDVIYSAILDVDEKDQNFVSSLLLFLMWKDENISWQPHKLCNIWHFQLPTTLIWTPDLTIEEMIKIEKALPNPYVWVDYDGEVYQKIQIVVTSACKMEVYAFPFDVQSCDLSLKPIIHGVMDIELNVMADPNRTREWTQEMMRTGSEWLFVNLTTENKTVDNFGFNRSMLVFTITMKRRSVLYVANFLLPVLFFFLLDLASFLITERGGEKLSFKVTVLLAVTVMQLILNEILPSTSDRVPLIAVYCIGIFGLMMISLFETILVIYLMEKDNEADEDERLSVDSEDKHSKVGFCSCCKELKKWTPCARVCDVSVDEPPSELLSATKEGNSSEMTEESIALEKLSSEMKEVIQLLNNREEAGKLGYWTRMAKTINRVFFISYVTVASVFLVVLFSLWNN